MRPRKSINAITEASDKEMYHYITSASSGVRDIEADKGKKLEFIFMLEKSWFRKGTVMCIWSESNPNKVEKFVV